MHLNSVGELTRIEGCFTFEHYLRILEDVMIPTVRAIVFLYPEKILFTQDSSSIQRAHIVNRWFAEQWDVEMVP